MIHALPNFWVSQEIRKTIGKTKNKDQEREKSTLINEIEKLQYT